MRNGGTNVSLSQDSYEVEFVSGSASVSVVFPRIKFPYPNCFMIFDF